MSTAVMTMEGAEAPQARAVRLDPLRDYLTGLAFRLVHPEMPFPDGLLAAFALQACARAGLSLDVYNAALPAGDFERRVALGRLCGMARASTYCIAAIIDKAVSLLDDEAAFVNVGVWQGFTFLAGLAGNPDKRCIGIDNFSTAAKKDARGRPAFRGLSKLAYGLNDRIARRAFYRNFERLRSERHSFFEMDYVDYFRSQHQGPIGFYIYDAQHRYRDQLRGLELAEPFFTADCVVLVDDTNAADNRRATYDFMQQSRHDYEVLLDRRTAGNRHPTFWNGVLVFRRVG